MTEPLLLPLTGEKLPPGPMMVLDWTLAVLTFGPRYHEHLLMLGFVNVLISARI